MSDDSVVYRIKIRSIYQKFRAFFREPEYVIKSSDFILKYGLYKMGFFSDA